MDVSENHDPLLRRYVEVSIERRARLFKVRGWACIASSPLFVLPALFAPVRPGEEGIAAGFFVFATLLVVLGVRVIRAASSQGARIRELVYAKPHEVASIQVLVLQHGGGARIPTVQIVDSAGKKYGLIMPGVDIAKLVVERTMK